MRPLVRELIELTRVRVLLFVREPEAVFWVLVFPLVLAVVLGFAFRDGAVAPSRVSVLGDAPELSASLAAAENVQLVPMADVPTAARKLQSGAIDVMVVAGSPPEIRFDAGRSEGSVGRLRVLRALEHAADPARAPSATESRVAETGPSYMDFLFPGLLGMNLMGTGIWGIGFALGDMRQKKLLKRFLVTPMRRSSLLLSFLFSRLVFLTLELAVLLLVGRLVLGVPLEGNLLTFGICCIVGALSFGGVGLLAASRSQTLEGISGIMNFLMLPMWLCSGVFFSYERFPDFLHPVLRAIPLTALNDALRKIMLDGEGLAAVLPELAITAAWGVVSFVVALRIFRWN